MLCFEIQLNGKKKLLAGHKDLSELGLSIDTLDEKAFLEVNAGIYKGSSPPDYLFWDGVDFKVGDEITVKLLDSNEPDPPTRISHDHDDSSNDKKPKVQRQMLCSSCKKPFRERDKMIKMPSVILCNECIDSINDFISDCPDES